MIFNEITCHVNSTLGMGGCTPAPPSVSAPVFYAMTLSPHKRKLHDFWKSPNKRLFHNFWIMLVFTLKQTCFTTDWQKVI